MKFISIKGTIISVFLAIISIAVYADGAEGYSYDWTEIKYIKGGAKECTISIGDEGTSDTKAYFDEKGNIIKYQTADSLQNFLYDKSGRLSEIKNAYLENDKFILGGKTVYQYDANGKLKKISYYDGEGDEYIAEDGITYDKNGNINIERLTPEGSVYGINIYNKDFNIIEMIKYTTESVAMGQKIKDVESKTTIKYDKDGNMSEYVINYVTPEIKTLKTITQKLQYTLDNKGNKVKQVTTLIPEQAKTDMFSDLVRPTIIKFKYDDESNKKDTSTSNIKDDKNQKKEVLVKYQGEWYAAVILEQKDDKYLIHYLDYDSSWDEWVTKDRIKEKE